MGFLKKKKLIIFGTGEIGSLARFYFEHDSEYEVVAFCADDDFVKEAYFEGLPLVRFSLVKDRFPPETHEMHVALSYRKFNKIREEKYGAAKGAGYKLATYISTKAAIWPGLVVGDNCFILENQTIQPRVVIGNNVMIWSGNHIGHGVVIRDHAYVSSHVCIAGHSIIGARCFLGVNSTIKDFVELGQDVFVTMGACVTKNIEEGAVVIAAQGETFLADSRIANKLKKEYFLL